MNKYIMYSRLTMWTLVTLPVRKPKKVSNKPTQRTTKVNVHDEEM